MNLRNDVDEPKRQSDEPKRENGDLRPYAALQRAAEPLLLAPQNAPKSPDQTRTPDAETPAATTSHSWVKRPTLDHSPAVRTGLDVADAYTPPVPASHLLEATRGQLIPPETRPDGGLGSSTPFLRFINPPQHCGAIFPLQAPAWSAYPLRQPASPRQASHSRQVGACNRKMRLKSMACVAFSLGGHLMNLRNPRKMGPNETLRRHFIAIWNPRAHRWVPGTGPRDWKAGRRPSFSPRAASSM